MTAGVPTVPGRRRVQAGLEFLEDRITPTSVTGLSPSAGPLLGGTLVTITGTGFTRATAVDFGTNPATNLTVVSDTTITAYSPAGTGTVDVTVTTPGGTSATSTADQFTYVPRRLSRASARRLVAVAAARGDDHRDRLHRRHGGRLRHDAGDDLHRRSAPP